MRKVFNMSQKPVCIIGAGISGVALGRCLSKYGIPAVLYDPKSTSPRNGYGITLHASTYRPLLKVLGIDETTFRKRVAVDAAVGGHGYIDPKKLVCPASIGSSSFRAHRDRLERLIREGLDIRWGHALDKIQLEQPSGSPTFLLQNEEPIDQQFVVGADGVHSTVRKSLLPKIEPEILPFVSFNGKRRVKRDVFESLYAPAMQDSNVIEVRKNNTLLHVSVNDNTDADMVSISWIFSRPSRGSTDACYKPNRPMAAANEIPEDFYREVDGMKDLEQPFKEVFDEQKLRKDRVLLWLMRSVDTSLSDLQKLAEKNILLMGDSVHAQAILGGEGANVAITDGLALAEHIATNDNASLDQWYESRHPSWREGLEKSKGLIEELHSGQKSVL